MNFRDLVFWFKNYAFRPNAISQYKEALKNQTKTLMTSKTKLGETKENCHLCI